MQKLYKRLSDSEDDFRVLHLLPGDRTSKIQTRLIEARLSAAPIYYSISYTWGPAGDEVGILVDDVSVSIRRHLWTCLQQMRRHNRFSLLWVDALCISQHDAEEKNQQVRLIGRIFQQAKSMLLWLGEAGEYTDKLFEVARKAVRLEDTLEGFAAWTPYDNEVKLTDESKADINRGMEDVLSRPYWTRRWVIQECLFADKIEVCCGAAIVNIRQLYSASHFGLPTLMSILSGGPPQDSTPEISDQNVFHQIYLGRMLQPRGTDTGEHTRQNLSELLTTFKGAECSDPRDEIISLLELSQEAQANVPARLVADYVSLPILYFRALHAWMSIGGTSHKDSDPYPLKLRAGTSLTVNDIVVAILEILGPDGQLLSPFECITNAHLSAACNIDVRGKIYDHQVDLCDECERTIIEVDIQRLATGRFILEGPNQPPSAKRDLHYFYDENGVVQLLLRRPGQRQHKMGIRLRQILGKQVSWPPEATDKYHGLCQICGGERRAFKIGQEGTFFDVHPCTDKSLEVSLKKNPMGKHDLYKRSYLLFSDGLLEPTTQEKPPRPAVAWYHRALSNVFGG